MVPIAAKFFSRSFFYSAMCSSFLRSHLVLYHPFINEIPLSLHSWYYYLILTQHPGCLKYWYWDWRAKIWLHYTGLAFANDTIVTLFMQYKSILCFSLIEDLKFYLSSLIFLRSSLVIVFKVKHPICMCVNVYWVLFVDKINRIKYK